MKELYGMFIKMEQNKDQAEEELKEPVTNPMTAASNQPDNEAVQLSSKMVHD